MTTANQTTRSGTDRRKNCDKPTNCEEHSGMKVMIMTILVGVVVTVLMQAYNNFVATADIKSSIAETKGEITGIRSEMKAMDLALDKRVSTLEETVYRKK